MTVLNTGDTIIGAQPRQQLIRQVRTNQRIHLHIVESPKRHRLVILRKVCHRPPANLIAQQNDLVDWGLPSEP